MEGVLKFSIDEAFIGPYDLNNLNYFSGSAYNHSFSLLNIFLVFFALFSLTTLFRPALFYTRIIWRKIVA